jgi:putative addiction module component (TIGR02574 family)
MTTTVLDVSSVLQNVLSLPRPERSYIMERLVVSLDADDDMPVSQAWRKELNSRVEAVRDGTLATVPHDEVLSEARALIAGIRKEKLTA